MAVGLRVDVAFFNGRQEAVKAIQEDSTIGVAVYPWKIFETVCHILICRNYVDADRINAGLLTQRGLDVHFGSSVFQSQVFRGDKPTLKAELAAALGANIIE
ncbi:MAG: hypothetical protein UV74_C0002G0059 [Candidatus Woesebacteria bacterium GW2011_GWB1_43_14]|uniref:Uncharacterized protein n=1 Tax=Candidatus Woesebacteria bacterium GW2011_GWB1_43_14 TaxID=1618578 RepID=A0A0G1GJ90_9BACT|nr:MAG: hypothetical protein UV51_C0004G0008 [Candidatus Woesebacteria bacterium GW2011_GWC1_42_9]KKS98838.1 MAG: hypothetical protein UV74_C0002G0059 [Candidatus Woesebacteria bacterium GW2011_GWB1_43_14]